MLTTLHPLAKFQLAWRRFCEALLSSSSLAGQKHPSLLSRLCPKRRRYKDRFSLNIKIKLSIIFICRHRGCAHSDVRSLNTAIVEAPIERHKSRLASRETGDGLTGTHSGGSMDRTESVPKWSRKRRACAGLMVDGTKPCARQAFTILHFPET